MRIADMPVSERPSERLRRHGIGSLSDSELLAVILGSGIADRSAIDIARSLVNRGLATLARAEWPRLVSQKGIGPSKAARLLAAFELGRRAQSVEYRVAGRDPVQNPERIARSLLPRYAHQVQERLGSVFLDAKNRVIAEREIYVGTLNSATVSTREILKYALEENAVSVIVYHNHPSGDPAPSGEDVSFTRKLVEAGRVLGVDVLDHLILGCNRYVSLKERGGM